MGPVACRFTDQNLRMRISDYNIESVSCPWPMRDGQFQWIAIGFPFEAPATPPDVILMIQANPIRPYIMPPVAIMRDERLQEKLPGTMIK